MGMDHIWLEIIQKIEYLSHSPSRQVRHMEFFVAGAPDSKNTQSVLVSYKTSLIGGTHHYCIVLQSKILRQFMSNPTCSSS